MIFYSNDRLHYFQRESMESENGSVKKKVKNLLQRDIVAAILSALIYGRWEVHTCVKSVFLALDDFIWGQKFWHTPGLTHLDSTSLIKMFFPLMHYKIIVMRFGSSKKFPFLLLGLLAYFSYGYRIPQKFKKVY